MLSVGAVRPLTTAAPLGGAKMMESDDDALSVGAVRPLANAAPLGGAGMMDDCQQRADAKDDVLSMGPGPDGPTWDVLCAVGRFLLGDPSL